MKAKGTPEPGEAPYALLKFEGGVHRVQRVPVTESQGRVHTCAAGVLVMPEAEHGRRQHRRATTCASTSSAPRGPGGQSVNTTDSAVRITHLPTGIVVSCQNEKTQLQNKEQALRILRARLLAAAQEEADAEACDARRSQVRTVDRSERIRTYNFPENRISDHRTGYKAYNLDQVLDGDLQPVVDSLRRGRPRGPARRARGRDRAAAARRWPRARGRQARRGRGASPEHDAAELLAHVLGTARGRLPLLDRPTSTRRPSAYDELVARRARASRCST